MDINKMETYETLLNRFDAALIEKELLNDEIKEQKEVFDRLLMLNIEVENNYVLGLKDTIKEQKKDIKRLFEKINTLNNKVNNNINLTSKGVK